MKKILFIFCSVLFLQPAFSQQSFTHFDHDSVKFLEQVENYMNTGLANRSDVKDFVKKFSLTWHSAAYNDYYKKITYLIADDMLAKNMQVYPTFQTFLVTMNNFVKSGLGQDKFDQWQGCLEKLMKKRPYNNANIFLAMSADLFGSDIIFKSPTFYWSSNIPDYTFNCDSVPEIIFDKLDLKCTNENKDTLVIYDTKGVYYPLKGTWAGEGGRTDWTRTGLDANTVYAELKNYNITFKEGGYIADSVLLTDKTYFTQPIEGRLIEKDISEPKGEESYPRFLSYGKRYTIEHLTPDVAYDGGFSMRGRRFVGSGSKEEPAELIFKRKGKPFLITSAADYSITKDNIMTDDASIIILIDHDTIYHPDVQLAYNINTRHVSLIRSDEGLSGAPFFDTYHKVNMFFEELSWYIEQPDIEFRMLQGATQDIGNFESQDFFRPDLYAHLKNSSGESELVLISNYTKANKTRDMSIDDLASYLKVMSNDLYPELFLLAKLGLIKLDLQQHTIHVQDKLFRFIADNQGKADYDVIDFHSTNPGKIYKYDSTQHRRVEESLINDSTARDNGILNLNNNDIYLNGITYVVLSDSQDVQIYPDNRKLTLHKDREATFSGEVDAGRFTFFGKQFDFNYKDFTIKMKNADSLILFATTFDTDAKGRHPLVLVKSVIRHLSGELKIDKTNNKSGIQQLKQYPILKSDSSTFVYYDKKDIQSGVYKKDNFYFKADTFTIDSVKTFSNSRLHFAGTFASDDIVPEMRETLRLQPDYSLGFVHNNPPEGLSLYKGKGKLFNKLKLSNQGLIGDGAIHYVTSVSQSKKFIFFPDSMNAQADDFEMTEQKSPPEFPEIHGDTVDEHWLPKRDSMFVKDTYKPYSQSTSTYGVAFNFVKDTFRVFTCYHNSATFHGTLTLTPKILTGKGRFDFKEAYLTSNIFKFYQHRIASDTANFNLKRVDSTEGIAFATNNMKSDIDFEKREGNFSTNGKGSDVEFIQNEYIAYMDAFKWYMDEGTLEFGSKNKQTVSSATQEISITGSKFVSVAPHQDSLQFIAPRARWNIRTYVISAHDVPFIDVADARIFPDSGNVTVLKKAFMVPLVKATITANNVTKYYHLYNADLTVTSRKNFSGSGYYDFLDELKHKTPLYFNNIHVDTSHQTVASANISDTSNFSFSPHFKYKGAVYLKASNPNLFFDGATRISHDCNELKISWLKFASQVDPDNIQIALGRMVNESGVPLAASPVMTTADSISIYPAFLSPVIRPKKDSVIVVPDSAFITFDKTTQQYRISNKEKLTEQSLPGNYASLDTRKCILYGEGNLNLGVNYQPLEMRAVGNITDYIIPDTIVSHISLLLNFFFDDNALDKMATDANSFSNLKPVDFGSDELKKNLRQIMGTTAADKLVTQLSVYGNMKKVPKELSQSTLFLTNVKLKWSNDLHAYVSQGPIGVVSVGRTFVNKEADGVIELRKNRVTGGDVLNIYISFDPMHWYFFTYTGGLLSAVSSVQPFNDAISAVKPDKREQKTDQGKYSFSLGDPLAKTVFLKRLEGDEQ